MLCDGTSTNQPQLLLALRINLLYNPKSSCKNVETIHTPKYVSTAAYFDNTIEFLNAVK